MGTKRTAGRRLFCVGSAAAVAAAGVVAMTALTTAIAVDAVAQQQPKPSDALENETVTISAYELPIKTLAAAMARRYGLTIVCDPALAESPVTCSFNNVPIGLLLETLARSVGAELRRETDDAGAAIIAIRPHQSPSLHTWLMADAASAVGVSAETIRAAVASGELPSTNGRISRRDLHAWLCAKGSLGFADISAADRD